MKYPGIWAAARRTRQALLRNLVTSLIKLETIHTTWHKAKEAQRPGREADLVREAGQRGDAAEGAGHSLCMWLSPRLTGYLSLSLLGSLSAGGLSLALC